MAFSRQEYWSELPFSSLGDLPNPGIEPVSPALQAVSCIVRRFFTEPPGGTSEIKFQSLVQEDPLEEKMHSTPVSFLGESHGQRSLVGYSP